jgi:putative transcription factor
MMCEMCGQEVPRLRKITIEGSVLSVCSNCVKFGSGSSSKGEGEATVPDTITERLERRERRLKTRDVFESTQKELALDYSSRIRKGRQSKGMSQEDLGKKINEKKSVVAKLEHGDMRPDEKLIRKLERALDISLKETLTKAPAPQKTETPHGMTLGDFIRTEKK